MADIINELIEVVTISLESHMRGHKVRRGDIVEALAIMLGDSCACADAREDTLVYSANALKAFLRAYEQTRCYEETMIAAEESGELN